MIITDVTTTKLCYRMSVPMADAIHYMPERSLLLVHVHTDEGIVGLARRLRTVATGESGGARPRGATEHRRGSDPFRVEKLWNMMATRRTSATARHADDGYQRH
ncbi:MAG: hypothetical protein WKH64_08920 [Chloroflexia bacterium]